MFSIQRFIRHLRLSIFNFSCCVSFKARCLLNLIIKKSFLIDKNMLHCRILSMAKDKRLLERLLSKLLTLHNNAFLAHY